MIRSLKSNLIELSNNFSFFQILSNTEVLLLGLNYIRKCKRYKIEARNLYTLKIEYNNPENFIQFIISQNISN